MTYIKDSHNYPYRRPVLSTDLEIPVVIYMYKSLGHLGTEKCIAQIAKTFRVKSLGRKVRKFISRCDTCQRVKHPNRSYAAENLSHLSSKPGDPYAVGRYLLGASVFDIFSYVSTCFEI